MIHIKINMKQDLYTYLRNLDLYNDYYGGPIIEEVIEEIKKFYSNRDKLCNLGNDLLHIDDLDENDS